MKKMIIVLATGIITTAAMAQENSKPAPPSPPADMTEMPAPPPPPVPPPPPPPPPPINRLNGKTKTIAASGVNSKGYIIKVVSGKEEAIILASKNGVTQKIRMSVWNAKPSYFEHKYGELPPPPPPPPAPPHPPLNN